MFPPSAVGLSIDGRPLLRLDATAGAVLTASLRSDGIPRPLSAEQRTALEEGRALAQKAAAETVFDAETRGYFGRLAALAAEVLRG